MSKQLIATLAVIVALIMGALAVALPPDRLHVVIFIAKFFDVMLPILGVGALVKYLMK